MSRPGLFITFEGIDGAGKSSHIEGLAAAFRTQGRTVTVSREPGGTPLAEKLREMVLNDPMDALTESLLIFAARRDHLRNVIEPALARGEVVLCDRFTDATFAYQGAGRGFDLGALSTLEHLAQTGLAPQADLMREPDLTVWFDLAPEVAAERLAGALGGDPRRHVHRGPPFAATMMASQPRRTKTLVSCCHTWWRPCAASRRAKR